MSLDDLLPQNRGKKNSTKATTDKSNRRPGRPGKDKPQMNITIRHDVSTKVLLEKIQKVRELTEPQKVSQGDIVREALNLLAEQMDLPKKEKKYAQFMRFIEEKYQ